MRTTIEPVLPRRASPRIGTRPSLPPTLPLHAPQGAAKGASARKSLRATSAARRRRWRRWWNRAERDSLPQAARRAAPEGAGKGTCRGVSTRQVKAISEELCGHEFSARGSPVHQPPSSLRLFDGERAQAANWTSFGSFRMKRFAWATKDQSALARIRGHLGVVTLHGAISAVRSHPAFGLAHTGLRSAACAVRAICALAARSFTEVAGFTISGGREIFGAGISINGIR